MLTPLIIFVAGIIGIALFLIYKAPALTELSEDEEESYDVLLTCRKRGKEAFGEVKCRFEKFLQILLSAVRKILIKVEKVTTKWLYVLKRKQKKKEKMEKKEE